MENKLEKLGMGVITYYSGRRSVVINLYERYTYYSNNNYCKNWTEHNNTLYYSIDCSLYYVNRIKPDRIIACYIKIPVPYMWNCVFEMRSDGSTI